LRLFSTVATIVIFGETTEISDAMIVTIVEAGMVVTAATVSIATGIVVIPMAGGIRWQHSEQVR
jgi:hypothetical protein